MSKRKPKTKSTPKKRNRRSSVPYPALQPELNLRSRWELIDYDYIDKLSPEEKAWLNKFTAEYVNADFDRKNVKNNLHNKKEWIQETDARNYLRKTDALTRAKASGENVYLEDIKENDEEVKDYLGEIRDEFNNTNGDGESDA
jgi:hypothetical protein